MTLEEALKYLRHKAHVHDEHCYGRYEPCEEHHVHDGACGSRERLCRRPEEPELIVLLKEFDCLRALDKEPKSIRCSNCVEYGECSLHNRDGSSKLAKQ